MIFIRKNLYFLILLLLSSRIPHKSLKYQGYSFEGIFKNVWRIRKFEKPKFSETGKFWGIRMVQCSQNQVMKNKNLHRAVQSNGTFFEGFNHVKYCCF